jgi:hypothetical protein
MNNIAEPDSFSCDYFHSVIVRNIFTRHFFLRQLLQMSDSETEPALNSLNLRVPPFKYGDPEFWFARLETFFTTQRITSQASRFGYASSFLPDDIAEQVRDILVSPPASSPYDKLKQEVIRRTSVSAQRRIQQLLTGAELGDRTPSQLLRHMQQLIGAEKVDQSLIRQLWLQRLPTMVQQILASNDDSTDLARLAEIADRIMSCSMPCVNAVSSTLSNPLLEQLSQKMEILSAQVMALQLRSQQRTGRRNRRNPSSRSRQKSRSSSRPPDVCKYHHRYGDRAFHCILPCKFSHLLSGNDRAGE